MFNIICIIFYRYQIFQRLLINYSYGKLFNHYLYNIIRHKLLIHIYRHLLINKFYLWWLNWLPFLIKKITCFSFRIMNLIISHRLKSWFSYINKKHIFKIIYNKFSWKIFLKKFKKLKNLKENLTKNENSYQEFSARNKR